ncbi:hypothetical protein HDU82_001095 [Entophlyctis luteolus]|nr:hypothetical protein HDU82_001095 [Entophlyctis luteolus]
MRTDSDSAPIAEVRCTEDGAALHTVLRTKLPGAFPSRGHVRAALALQQVRVNGVFASSVAQRLQHGDTVHVARRREDAVLQRARATGMAVEAVDDASQPQWAVVWKPAGVSLQPTEHFVANVLALLPPSVQQPLHVVNSVSKADSGLVVLATEELQAADVICTYRCIVHGRVGSAPGETINTSATVQDTACSTTFTVVSHSRSRNTPTGYLTTLDATPTSGFLAKQVLAHLRVSGSPVVGSNSNLAQPLSREKGCFASVVQVRFRKPDSDGEMCTVTKDEPSKFEALRAKEQRFYDRKVAEIHSDGQLTNPEYARGEVEFRGLKLKVTPAVMIPRQSSSILVDTAVEAIVERSPLPESLHVLDLGTGSASLLISTVKQLESLFPSAEITGVGIDASIDALDIAEQNISLHRLQDRVKTRHLAFANLVSVFRDGGVAASVILCNPPYLVRGGRTVGRIDTTLLDEEPEIALYATGSTGMEAYEEMASGMRTAEFEFGERAFARGCVLVAEVAHGTAARVEAVLLAHQEADGERCGLSSEWVLRGRRRDVRGLERCVVERNRIIEDTFRDRFASPEPEKLYLTLHDFDGVSYSLETKDSKSVVYFSMNMRCYSELRAYGADAVLRREYGNLLQASPEPGFDVTLRIDEDRLQGVDKDVLVKKLALLKRNALAAPFEAAFLAQEEGRQTGVMTVNYRDQESIFIMGFPDRVTVIFSTVFKEEADQIYGRVFLQEFVDARRQPAIQNAPQVLYSAREPPLEIRGLRLPEVDNIGYVTFVLFPRHFPVGPVREETISRIQLFRDYLHYHIKASKAYMHSRMRARVESFLKVLNRAKPEKPDELKERKTIAGKTFKH